MIIKNLADLNCFNTYKLKPTIEKSKYYDQFDYDFTTPTQNEINVIALWKIKRYSVKSICAALWLEKEQVNRIISSFRSIIRKTKRRKRNWRKGARFSVTDDQISRIKQYCDETKNKPIKIKDIKQAVWPAEENRYIPTNSTISSILKNELNMRYKVLQTRNLITKKPENRRLFCQSLALQNILRNANTELIYVDEFNFSSRK